jgi:predicted amidophosphoribosyltransferase
LDDLTARLDAQRRAAVPPPLPPLPVQTTPGRCPSCGHPVEPEDQFCTQCRAQLVAQVRQCPNPACRAYPGPHDRYCIFCGTVLAVKE